MSKFEGTTCDSCGASVKDTQVKGWAEVTFWGFGEKKVLDLCPQCADCVSKFIDNGCGREYTRGERRAE